MDLQAFYTGRAFDAYEFFGAHPCPGGVHFAVWAPAARQVSVVTDGGDGFDLRQTHSAVWEGTWQASFCQPGLSYQYRVVGADGTAATHCDPYGFAMALRPSGYSVVTAEPSFPFTDEAWLKNRTKNFDSPLTIYEVHAGSWRQKPDGSFYSYAELAELLPAYAKANGFTHLELMPLAEYPFDGSWGYQTTGFYAPTSRYGTPAELAGFIDACHRQGVGVILDFVPVHFAVDDYGLKRFDGTPLYEYPSADVGESEWGSCNFIHSRGEVRCFLQSCAAYWLGAFHADGLRMDAVSRLLYWQGDAARGVNGTAVEFLKNMNAGLQQRYPTAMLIAEDSTNYPKVTAPVAYGGLGFDYKWDLGWMNDTLDYFKKSPAERKQNFGRLSFSMVYCWNEHYILPFSHDENVHGKATILQKMYGPYADKFPQGRLLYLYRALHPGKKLDFMGNELGQLREWDESRAQDWSLLDYPLHKGFACYRHALAELYADCDAFWQGEYDPARFLWLDCDTAARGACAILRRGEKTTVFGLLNFSDEPLENYKVALPGPGKATLLLDTDWQCWGGAGLVPNVCLPQAATSRFAAPLAPYSGRLYAFQPAQTAEPIPKTAPER